MEVSNELKLTQPIILARSLLSCFVKKVIIGMLMPLLKDLTVGGQGFFILIGMLVIVAMACKHFSDKGYNICEIAGGRPGGASG